MSNRYTQTSLTKRQIESMNSAENKLLVIYRQRAEMPQEIKGPIDEIRKAIVALRTANELWEEFKQEQRRESQ